MEIQERFTQEQSSDEKPNLVITITMKKMDNQVNSGAGTSTLEQVNGDSNNNEGVTKSAKKVSTTKWNPFNKSSQSGDKNNNPPAPVSNQYTKVSVDSLMSHLTFHQNNRQMMNQLGNTVAVNDVSKRFTKDETRNDDSDAQRVTEIQECVKNASKADGSNVQRSQEPSCANCLLNQKMNIHSQDYYRHFLVPDLEKITGCCYYWGKMDRYEAEKLLEGKPEGTFLLRDSAQDDYLFSVSFRKYGRSLHARIEQLNKKFSFDAHDPSVYTAQTVTGLVEHYKDPTSIMFFEPMLTSPLHRNYVFSLQQLCRASIVSQTTYDGVNDLCLPATMKSYLKEYHYKLKVRVRPDNGTTLSS